MANKAAWQVEKQGPFTVGDADMYEPGKGEIRIKVSVFNTAVAEARLMLAGPRCRYSACRGQASLVRHHATL